MNISHDQIRTLVGFVAKTTDTEISCQTCEDQLAQYAEAQFSGKGVTAALSAIEKHLKICPECSEELNYLCRALEGGFDKN